MAGTVHEVENHALLAEVEREAANAAQELVEAARLHRGQIVVIGCSTSEVVGHQVGSWSTPEAAQAIFRGLQSVFAPRGVYLAAQCCEHLNRALIVEHEAVPNAEIVNVLPQPKAGSSFATAAYESFRHPVALEEIRADAGLDIGGTSRRSPFPCGSSRIISGRPSCWRRVCAPNSSAASAPSTTRSSRTAIPISTQSNRKAPLSRCFFAALFTSCGRSARRFPRRARACCRRAGRRAGSLSRSASPPRSGGSA